MMALSKTSQSRAYRQSKDWEPPPKRIERNPEATGPLSRKHVRVLQNMLNFKLAKAATRDWEPKQAGNDFLKAEIAALNTAIVELNALLDERESEH